MTNEEILKKANSFQGANREFSQELPKIVEALLDKIDAGSVEVVDDLTSNSPTKALSANQGKILKGLVDSKVEGPEDAGAAGQILQLDENGKPEWVDAAEVGATYDSAVSDSSTNAIQNKAIKAYADTKAAKDGYYSTLTSGASENLVGRGSVPAKVNFRTSGGDADLGSGSALITKLKGNSIVWNQLVGSSDSSVTVPSGHKYYAIIGGTASVATSDGTAISVTGGTDICIDLTKMGIADQISTVADFQALYPLPYYAYNAGTIVNNSAEKLVTTGFNQWDEEWRRGHYDANGQYNSSPDGNYISNVNSIRVLPSKNYHFKIPLSSLIVVERDLSGSVLSRYNVNNGASNVSFTITTSANTFLLDFTVGSSSYPITTYNHDICINLSWSGYRNGEYEPYEKHTLEIDPAEWEDTDGNLIFPYGGMLKAGSAYDFAKAENDGYFHYGTRVIGRVDLGTLPCTYYSTYGSFNLSLTGIKKIPSGTIGNIVTANYITIAKGTSASFIAATGKIIAEETNQELLLLKDPDHTASDIVDGKAPWLSGQYLYYEMATPVEKELATPVPASYYVNDFGTEAKYPADTASAVSAPLTYDVQYAMNAVDTLRRLGVNYIKKDSMDHILTAFKTAGIIADYTLTYDATNDDYTCTITAPAPTE